MNKHPVQIVTHFGRDAEIIASFLGNAGLQPRITPRFLDLFSAEERDAMGTLLIAEETLTDSVIARLSGLLLSQPNWSDLPILVLTSAGRETPESVARQQARIPLGHFSLLERPIRPSTLLATVESAIRSRKRQFEIRDAIQQRDLALAELQISEEKNRLIAQSTHDCVILLGFDGNIVSINEEGRRRRGIEDFEKLRNRSWFYFWEGSSREAAMTALKAAREGSEGRFEGFYKTPDGEPTWWDISVTPVMDGEHKMVNLLAVSREISSRKLAEKALIQSEKLAAVGRLASSISHEINNPLEAIINLLYLAKEDPEIPPHLKEYLQQADAELVRVSQIVGQTLRFHRQSTAPQWTNIGELFSSTIALYHGRLLNSGIRTEIDVSGEPTVLCFEGEIRQVLNNLVGNAIDAMRGSGGTMLLRARPSINWRTMTPGVSIVVCDEGHGMDRQTASRIFEPFFTTKGIHGTGLGLWILHGIIEKHHGSVRVRSQREPARHGTLFRIFLPLTIEKGTEE